MVNKQTKTLYDEAIKDLSNNPIPNYYWEKNVKEFIKWVETEIIMRSPDKRINLIKLKNRVGKELLI